MPRVLITDRNFKHAKAAARSLRAKGLDVVTPRCNPQYSCLWGEVDCIIPVSYNAVMSLDYKRSLVHGRFMLPSRESLQIAASKGKTIDLAKRIGVPVPVTITSDFARVYQEYPPRFPFVVKSQEGSGSVRYANNREELKRAVERTYLPLIQEYVEGEGYGYFAVYKEGTPVAEFMHHRLREFPATGGPSTWAESVYIPELRDLGRKMLDMLGWHGPAMVEFKRTASGRFVLMEINPKLWGSLELGMQAGVDFPYLIYLGAMGREIPPQAPYKVGVRMRWFWWDLMARLTGPWYFPHGRIEA